MKIIGSLILLITVTKFSFSTNSITFESAYNNWILSKNNPGYIDHLIKITTFNNKKRIDTSKDCYKKSGGIIELILTHNKDGVIISAVPKSQSHKANCLVNLYLGIKFPKPPYSPYYERMLVK